MRHSPQRSITTVRLTREPANAEGQPPFGIHTDYAQLDDRDYPKGIEVTDQELDAVNIERDTFHGEWNYLIHPASTKA